MLLSVVVSAAVLFFIAAVSFFLAAVLVFAAQVPRDHLPLVSLSVKASGFGTDIDAGSSRLKQFWEIFVLCWQEILRVTQQDDLAMHPRGHPLEPLVMHSWGHTP